MIAALPLGVLDAQPSEPGLIGWRIQEPPPQTPLEHRLHSLFVVDARCSTLDQLLQRLRQTGVQAWVDAGTFGNAGISMKTKLDVQNPRRVRVKDALAQLLKPLNLTYVTKRNWIMITTDDEAEDFSHLVTRVFNVSSICEPGGEDELIDLITSTIDTDMWEDVGGPGAISSINLRSDQRMLVVSQTDEVVEKVSGLLLTVKQAIASGNGGRFGSARTKLGLRRSNLPRTKVVTPVPPAPTQNPGFSSGGFF